MGCHPEINARAARAPCNVGLCRQRTSPCVVVQAGLSPPTRAGKTEPFSVVILARKGRRKRSTWLTDAPSYLTPHASRTIAQKTAKTRVISLFTLSNSMNTPRKMRSSFIFHPSSLNVGIQHRFAKPRNLKPETLTLKPS